MKINNIKNPSFLKDLNIKELEALSLDMRNFILENVSQTGGHLSSNLGIVDLTIAMLKVFDANKDVIIFDVGHQSYPYKILTGRADGFKNLRKKDGLSGFQSINESKYDKYEGGHSSTSISAGLGFALARDLDKKDYNVISVIGDGSISNGLAYEALNQIGDLKTNQIIILNDNQMSISENVGALHNLLDSIRSGKGYDNAKKGTKSFLNKIIIGRGLAKFLHKVKELYKRIYLRKSSLFGDFGIEYYGPINGHDYKELLQYLKIAKHHKGPVILHVITQKGKGYDYAENDNIGKFHGIGAFDIVSGEIIKKTNLPSYSEIISSFLLNYAKKDKDIIAITPGMCYGSMLDTFKDKLPDQFLDVGIAEEHALVLANGLAIAGKKPYVFIYSTFMQRGYDELLHDIARMNGNVTLLIDRAGLVPNDGISHQGVFDVPMLMSMPNMIITSPKDAKEANDLIYTSLCYNGPFAIRYPKINLKYDYNEGKCLEIGSWEIIKEGNDGYIISYGDFVSKALEVSEKLKIDIGVVNARFIKPIDEKVFKYLLSKNKPIFVYEEATEIGSLASFLSLKANNYDFKNKIYTFAVSDSFLPHASREELLKMTGLSVDDIVKRINKKINFK